MLQLFSRQVGFLSSDDPGYLRHIMVLEVRG